MSALRNRPVRAGIVALPLNLLFIAPAIGGLNVDAGSWSSRLFAYFNMPLHFSKDFCRVVVDSRHVVLYASVALGCLFLTVRSLESQRWR